MSNWIDMAEAIATRMKTLTLMNDITVIVDQQKDLDTMVAIEVAKIGGAVVVQWVGGGLIPNSEKASPSTYQIRCYGSPILAEGVHVDKLAQAALMAINGWHPDARMPVDGKFTVAADVDLVPDATYVIYEFNVRGRVILTPPQFNEPTP